MLTTLLPLIALAQGGDVHGTPMRVTSPIEAQRVLADAIGTAESVDYVRATPRMQGRLGELGSVTFGVDRAGEAYALTATIDSTTGAVLALEIDDLGPAPSHEPGKLSWLVDVVKGSATITRLVVGGDGTVVVVTGESEQYQTVPGPSASARTNAAVEARWAVAWDD